MKKDKTKSEKRKKYSRNKEKKIDTRYPCTFEKTKSKCTWFFHVIYSVDMMSNYAGKDGSHFKPLG